MPYVIVGKIPNTSVYRVKPEDGSGGVRTLHLDHLLPISQSMIIPEGKDHVDSTVRPKTRLQRQSRHQRKINRTLELESEDTDSSSDMEGGGT